MTVSASSNTPVVTLYPAFGPADALTPFVSDTPVVISLEAFMVGATGPSGAVWKGQWETGTA